MNMVMPPARPSPEDSIADIMAHAVFRRTRTPWAIRKAEGVIRAAALLAADDAAERLLNATYFLYPPLGPCPEFADQDRAKAEESATELCDFATLAGTCAADLLREAARIHAGTPERGPSIAHALALIGRIAAPAVRS